MKHFILLFSLFFLSLTLFSQVNLVKLDSQLSENFSINVLEQNSQGLTLKLINNSYYFKDVITPRGEAVIVNSPKAKNNFPKGSPDLPLIPTSIMIPNQGGFSYNIISSEYVTVENIEIAPSKGTIYRNQDPEAVPYEYGREYFIDEFFPKNSAFISDPFIVRDLRGANISFFPFTYNAIQKELRVYSEIILKITFTNDNFPNQIENNKLKASYEFNNVYERHFINYKSSTKYTPIEEGTPGKILIISKDAYASAMTPYINWKLEKGIETEMVLISSIGTSSNDLKTFIQDYYDNNDLTYLLLVGDAEDIPPINVGSNYTDNGYTYLAGNDKYADIFIGRFSGNSIADIETQVQRTVTYERDLNASDTWLTNGFTSASNEGAGQGHNGESDVQHMNNIKDKLQTYGYTITSVNQQGGNNSQISSHFNAGTGIANYIGHGDETLWVNTEFTNSHVNALTNENKLPFIWSVACVNGHFKGRTCFAEAWLRAQKNNQPTGAIAFLGSTINQSWTEPMTAQDEMIDILIETYSSNIKRTFGGLSFNGMFKMIEAGGEGQSMADTWTIFGDPSLMVRTKTPQEMNISHNDVITIEETSFQVNCDEENALVSITKTQEDVTTILGTGYVNQGVATINFENLSEPGVVLLTITAFNKITYQEEIMIIVPSGPYVIHTEYSINDEEGNNNGLAEYNEIIYINETLKNVGVDVANSVITSLSLADEYHGTILEGEKSFGQINADETKTENKAFKLLIADGISDQTKIKAILTITDADENEWTSNIFIPVNAPKMRLYFNSLDDSELGNNDGLLTPGETLKLKVQVKNIGHASSVAGVVTISSESEYVSSINNSTYNISSLAGNQDEIVEFEISLAEEIPSDTMIYFNFNLIAGMYINTLSLGLSVGESIEDWESNTMTSFDWENDSDFPWTIVSDEVYEGEYALKSGTPTDGGESSLIINLDILSDDKIEFYKKVSCEPAMWGYMFDHFAFFIDGVEKNAWAGEVAWSKETFNVSAGQHELKWSYIKDAYFNQGQDCAWLDNIKLPPHQDAKTLIHTKTNISENSLNIYPNPAQDITYLNINMKENSSANVKIINLSGQIVYEFANPINIYSGENNILINTQNFTNGVYIVTVSTNQETLNSRLIINK
ncbi:MAG TPA: C25 family cysteine peptidase [Bacteroidales bacterium]|nr:C25 family cysteine peptidase [Bacteroidales bacterium]HQB21635.1 C25 family cysteine peptidase [Bacteroidales bacterium]